MNIRLITFITCLWSLLLTAQTAALALEQPLNATPSGFSQGLVAEQLLRPEQAFSFRVETLEKQTVVIRFLVAPGYYLYQQRVILRADNQTVDDLQLPPGEIKQDANFGQMEVFHQDFTLHAKLPKPLQEISRLTLSYQGCSEQGVCYAPITKTLNSAPSIAPSENNYPANLLASGHWGLIIAGFFGLGLLLCLTPCVLPMIPILSNIIIGDQQRQAGNAKAYSFYLGLAYTLGMALSYTLAGIAAALSGALVSQSLQSPWVLSLTALALAALALSNFGWYEIQLPQALQSRLLTQANRFQGGKLVSVFLMGVISALVVSPCVAAPLAGALIYISQTHNVWIGATALFSLSMGMGVPLLIIGASAGHLLPKAGAWMNLVRYVFGLLMLAVAISLLSSVLPVAIYMSLWALLFACPAIYLLRTPSESKWLIRLRPAAIVISLALSLSYAIAAITGAQSVLSPLEKVWLQRDVETKRLNWNQIQTLADLNQAIGRQHGKIWMLDFYADWCVSCKEMERNTFSDPAVAERLRRFELIQADVTLNKAEHTALLKHFQLFGPPAIIFINQDGQEIPNSRVIGYQNAAIFLKHVDKVLEIGEKE